MREAVKKRNPCVALCFLTTDFKGDCGGGLTLILVVVLANFWLRTKLFVEMFTTVVLLVALLISGLICVPQDSLAAHPYSQGPRPCVLLHLAAYLQ